jgi:hypothetical protein
MVVEPISSSLPKAVVSSRLDREYGVLARPEDYDELEKRIRPRSWERLSKKTANRLKALMQATAEGLGVSRFAYCELPILWVVDRKGNVLFGLEEIVEVSTEDFVLPRLRNTKVARGHKRLGHPALLAGDDPEARGRIGGEILYDVRAKKPAWTITNASGRYGTIRGRQPDHLSNVAKKFREHGIELQEVFYPPSRRQR